MQLAPRLQPTPALTAAIPCVGRRAHLARLSLRLARRHEDLKRTAEREGDQGAVGA